MQETQPYVVPPDAPVDVPIGAMADRLAEAAAQEVPAPAVDEAAD